MAIEYIAVFLYSSFYIMSLVNLNYAIFFYIFFIPIRNIIDISILGLFTPKIVFSFILLYHIFRNGYLKKTLNIKIPQLRTVIQFTIVFFIIVFFVTIRERILLLDYLHSTLTFQWFLNRTVTVLITIINLIVILKFFFLDPKKRELSVFAVISSAVVIVLSIYFAPFLESMGLNLREEIKSFGNFQSLGRVSGLFSLGDVNSLSTFLNLVICFILVQSSIEKKQSLMSFGICIFLSTGVLLSGSRMGFLTLIFISTYYVLFLSPKTKNSLNKISTYTVLNVFLMIMAIFSLNFLIENYSRFAMVFDRLESQGILREVSGEGQRLVRWLGFVNFTLNDMGSTLFGSNKIYYAFSTGDWRDPHNFFVKLFYLNGIVVFCVFVFFLCRLFTFFRQKKLIIHFIPLMITILISMMIISQVGFISHFILFISILIYKTQKIDFKSTLKGYL